MTEPYFCDGHSPIAQDWYESRTKSELGELVAELASRLYEIGMPEADEIAECNSDAKHFGKWIRMVRRVEGQLAPYREGMFRDGGEDECAND